MLLFRESIRGFFISFCIISTYSSIKEKYCLFLQQIKRKNDGKGKYKLISSPS